MSALDCQALYGDWPNWITDEQFQACTSGNLSASVIGSDNVEKAFNYFVEIGYSKQASAGIIGNLMQESGVDPSKLQGGSERSTPPISTQGWGIAQWSTVAYQQQLVSEAQSKNMAVNDIAFQLQFLAAQLDGNPTFYKVPELKAATTPQQAADIFEQGFERAGKPALANRENFAQQVYTQYQGNNVSGGGATTTADSSGGCGSTGTATADLNGFTYYSQCDPQWGKNPYGSTGDICANGCGPTSMAMIISNLSGSKITPDVTAGYALSNGLVTSTGSSYHAIAPKEAEHWGLTASKVNTVADVSAALQAGKLVILSGTGGLPFTTGGHYIVIRGLTSDSKWAIVDPYPLQGHTNSVTMDPAAVVAAGLNWDSAYAISK